jgi:hypothetical protein
MLEAPRWWCELRRVCSSLVEVRLWRLRAGQRVAIAWLGVRFKFVVQWAKAFAGIPARDDGNDALEASFSLLGASLRGNLACWTCFSG